MAVPLGQKVSFYMNQQIPERMENVAKDFQLEVKQGGLKIAVSLSSLFSAVFSEVDVHTWTGNYECTKTGHLINICGSLSQVESSDSH